MTRRVWFARDAQLTADPKVQAIADEFGAAGVLGYEEILALAKFEAEGGEMTATYAILARRAFLKSPRVAKKLVTALEALGLIEGVEQLGDRGFLASVPKWSRWQIKDPTNAERQAAYRERTRRRNGIRNAASNAGDVTSNGPTVNRGQNGLKGHLAPTESEAAA